MVPKNYQNWIEITSNIIHMVAFGVGFKCPRKIHLNTQCPPSWHRVNLSAKKLWRRVSSVPLMLLQPWIVRIDFMILNGSFQEDLQLWLLFFSFTFSAHIARLCSVQNKTLTSTLQAYIPNLLGILMIFPHLEWDQVMRILKNWEFKLKILSFMSGSCHLDSVEWRI